MSQDERLHSMDALRAGALLLGIVFHAGFAFIPGFPPGIWAISDSSPSTAISGLLFVSHIFRMSLFFFIAGFFARMMVQRRGLGGFWRDRAKRIALPLLVTWPIMAVVIGVVWVWGLTITFGGTLPAAPAEPAPKPFGALQLTHLWFLYYLLILYALLLGIRSIITRVDRNGRFAQLLDRAVRFSVRSGAAVVLLGLPLVAALYALPFWMNWFGIPTPDQSIIPQPVSLIAYGTAMTFGWFIHRQVDLLQSWGRTWWAYALVAIITTGICLNMVGVTPTFVPPTGMTKLRYAISYTVAIWAWIFALTGAAVRCLSNESPTRRYLADSSYWLYIVHLPVVVAFQIIIAKWPLPWVVKFPLLLVATFAVLLLSYHWLVRFTWIGKVLNGRRAGRVESVDPSGAPNPPVTPAALAELRGVHKRYDKQVALAGLDLEVHAGELLAVLGPNGAGKTTAIGLWLGLIEADAGTVRLMGRAPSDVTARREVGMMMQDVALDPTLRVRELIELAASYYPAPMPVAEALARTGTGALGARLYQKLSGGQKRLVQFAMAIVGQPRLLFLDEPTVGLDIEARQTMWASIRAFVAQGGSIVLTTHYLEEAEALADRVAVIANGKRIASGTVEEVRSLVVRKRISCATALDAAEVRAWPGVVDVRLEAAQLHITATDAESIVRRLLARDQALHNLEVRQAGLAEAFTLLTKDAA
jgi:ABC-type multidrug transport system ATPase subunit/peptidoglycan/LPS O-acetylase OafA/YrhL